MPIDDTPVPGIDPEELPVFQEFQAFARALYTEAAKATASRLEETVIKLAACIDEKHRDHRMVTDQVEATFSATGNRLIQMLDSVALGDLFQLFSERFFARQDVSIAELGQRVESTHIAILTEHARSHKELAQELNGATERFFARHDLSLTELGKRIDSSNEAMTREYKQDYEALTQDLKLATNRIAEAEQSIIAAETRSAELLTKSFERTAERIDSLCNILEKERGLRLRYQRGMIVLVSALGIASLTELTVLLMRAH